MYSVFISKIDNCSILIQMIIEHLKARSSAYRFLHLPWLFNYSFLMILWGYPYKALKADCTKLLIYDNLSSVSILHLVSIWKIDLYFTLFWSITPVAFLILKFICSNAHFQIQDALFVFTYPSVYSLLLHFFSTNSVNQTSVS